MPNTIMRIYYPIDRDFTPIKEGDLIDVNQLIMKKVSAEDFRKHEKKAGSEDSDDEDDEIQSEHDPDSDWTPED